MQESFLTALCLVFIIEGLFPFLFPHLWRRAILQMVTQPDRTLRIFGLISMLIGLGLLFLIRQ